MLCTRCGQETLPPRWLDELDPEAREYAETFEPDAITCDTCLVADRAPQGEALPLFTPAPAQLPGQTTFGPPMDVNPNVGAWPNWHR
jgi:hypothetical protein